MTRYRKGNGNTTQSKRQGAQILGYINASLSTASGLASSYENQKCGSYKVSAVSNAVHLQYAHQIRIQTHQRLQVTL